MTVLEPTFPEKMHAVRVGALKRGCRHPARVPDQVGELQKVMKENNIHSDVGSLICPPGILFQYSSNLA